MYKLRLRKAKKQIYILLHGASVGHSPFCIKLRLPEFFSNTESRPFKQVAQTF